jgi:hypothetical protein
MLDPSKMRKRFKDALAHAGVREIIFHKLRHTFGTQMAAAGAPQSWKVERSNRVDLGADAPVPSTPNGRRDRPPGRNRDLCDPGGSGEAIL